MFRLLVFLLFSASISYAPTDTVIDAANEFAAEFNTWALLKQHEIDNYGTVNARAILQWKIVRRKFERLDRLNK